MLDVMVIFAVGLVVGAAFYAAWGAWSDWRTGGLAGRRCSDCGSELEYIGFLPVHKGGRSEVTFWYCPACDLAGDGVVPDAISAFTEVGSVAEVVMMK